MRAEEKKDFERSPGKKRCTIWWCNIADLFEGIPQLLDSNHVCSLSEHLWTHQFHKILKVHSATASSTRQINTYRRNYLFLSPLSNIINHINYFGTKVMHSTVPRRVLVWPLLLDSAQRAHYVTLCKCSEHLYHKHQVNTTRLYNCINTGNDLATACWHLHSWKLSGEL